MMVDDAAGTADESLAPIDLDQVDEQLAVRMLEMMMLIRNFETTAEALSRKGAIPGGLHSALGQEATAVGIVSALADTDIVTGTHRSHHVTLAKGLTPREVMAELYGKATGCVGGRGGHMHLADIARGHFGSNGIVGGGLGIAIGAALAAALQNRRQVCVGFFGDGGANVGRVWESVNLAALWKLPALIVCENNLYAVETPVASATAGGDISRRAVGFGLPVETVDGQDVAAVFRTASRAVDRARNGEGPTFIEALTYRYGGHNVGEPETYRTRHEVDWWRSVRDPITRLTREMFARGWLNDPGLRDVQQNAQALVQDAVQFAEDSPYPDASGYADNVTAIDMKIRGNL